MPFGRSSGNFSSRSCGGSLQLPASSCCSYPSNLVYSAGLQSPASCRRGSSLYSGCRETFWEPTSCQRSCVVSRPCLTPCYRPRLSAFCSPCQATYSGSLGFGPRSCGSLGYGSRSCYSLGYGCRGFRPLSYGVCAFPSLAYGSGFCSPSYSVTRSCKYPCYRPTCRSGFWRSTC